MPQTLLPPPAFLLRLLLLTATIGTFWLPLRGQGQTGGARTMDGQIPPHSVWTLGAVTRMDTTRHVIHLAFTGHEFADGGEIIWETLGRHGAKGSFFFTGDFYRNRSFSHLIRKLQEDGHYLGAHSDKHLLYVSWENRDSLLVTRSQFEEDVRKNYHEMARMGVDTARALFFMPPYEWYNTTISEWAASLGLVLVNFTPGTTSNADYTTPDMGPRYVPSDSILARILRLETESPSGLNGFVLLIHIGTDPRRTDKLYRRLDWLLSLLSGRGYRFEALGG